MKHFLFFTILLVITISANCQLDKGYWLVGGSGSFYSYKHEFTNQPFQTITSGKLTEINLNANIGYFFIDKFVAGLRPGINSTKSHGGNSAFVWIDDVKVYVGPFARYYFLNKESQFNILLDGCYQLGSYSNFGKGTAQNASIMAGAEIFFNSSVGIELLFGYLYQKKNNGKNQNRYEDMKKGLNASIGFQIHLIKD